MANSTEHTESPDGTVRFKRRFITLRAEHTPDAVDLEVPSDRPVSELMVDILRALGWPTSKGGEQLHYALKSESGEVLLEDRTFRELGVENSDVLWVALVDQPAQAVADAASGDAAGEADSHGGLTSGFSPVAASGQSPKDRRGSLPPPVPASLPIESPSLVSRQGFIFVLGSPPISIGRSSPDHQPDIDLTDLDPEFGSSRQHALIREENGKLVLECLRTTNGTFVNGDELDPGEVWELSSGDEIQFGFEGVRLLFLLGGETIPGAYFS